MLLKYFALNHVLKNDTLAIYNEQLTGYYILEQKKKSSITLFQFLITTTKQQLSVQLGLR
jgi:hypothetical protein